MWGCWASKRREHRAIASPGASPRFSHTSPPRLLIAMLKHAATGLFYKSTKGPTGGLLDSSRTDPSGFGGSPPMRATLKSRHVHCWELCAPEQGRGACRPSRGTPRRDLRLAWKKGFCWNLAIRPPHETPLRNLRLTCFKEVGIQIARHKQIPTIPMKF